MNDNDRKACETAWIKRQNKVAGGIDFDDFRRGFEEALECMSSQKSQGQPRGMSPKPDPLISRFSREDHQAITALANDLFSKTRSPVKNLLGYSEHDYMDYWIVQATLIYVEKNPDKFKNILSQQSQGWKTIETAPKDGTEIIVSHPVGGVCAAFCLSEGGSWYCMDGSNTVTSKTGKSMPALTSFIEPPTAWQPMPTPPTTDKP